MRNFTFLTIHPNFIEAYKNFGIFRAAEQKKILNFNCINLRAFAVDAHGSVDDKPYGGGPGMLMRPEPLAAAVNSLKSKARVILLSARGRPWNQSIAHEWAASEDDLCFVCGRFEGIDQRFIDRYVDEEISVGAFVLSGGELPALSIVDSVVRLIPGVLGNEQSLSEESFSQELGGNTEYPQYTRPSEFEGVKVPPVLMSGNHKKITKWRREHCFAPLI